MKRRPTIIDVARKAGVSKSTVSLVLQNSPQVRAETRELVAGYWIWEVKDMDEAVAWVKRCPNPMFGPSEIEIRPVYEMSDFEAIMTPEAEAVHERVRQKLEGR